MEVPKAVELKRILVPVDFSEPSREALQFALSLAKPFRGTIRLLHVVQAFAMPPDVEVVHQAAFAEALNQGATKSLDKWREEVADHGQVEAELRVGTPYKEIVEAAGENNADLIILGTRGRTGLAGMLIGSTAERVVRHAACPVLVVRERKPVAGAGA
jgi:nucleotide-binding universal stress UspA family protein